MSSTGGILCIDLRDLQDLYGISKAFDGYNGSKQFWTMPEVTQSPKNADRDDADWTLGAVFDAGAAPLLTCHRPGMKRLRGARRCGWGEGRKVAREASAQIYTEARPDLERQTLRPEVRDLSHNRPSLPCLCLLYTSDAADE